VRVREDEVGEVLTLEKTWALLACDGAFRNSLVREDEVVDVRTFEKNCRLAAREDQGVLRTLPSRAVA